MTGTIKFDCNEREVNVTTRLDHVDMFDQAHLVMLFFEALNLDVSKDLEQIAELMAIASLFKRMNMTEGSKVDMSGLRDALEKAHDTEADEAEED